MKTLNDTEQKILTAIRNTVIAVSPSYTYDTGESNGTVNDNGHKVACTYVNHRDTDDNGKPVAASCLIGHGVVDSGLMSVEDASQWEGTGADDIVAAVRNGGVDASDDFISAMCDIQGAQDTFKPWQYSFEFGLDTLSGYGYDVKSYYL